MKRLTLQDLRSFVYKKGRLLYGAVFLFCLVLLYGAYKMYIPNFLVSMNESGLHSPEVVNPAVNGTKTYEGRDHKEETSAGGKSMGHQVLSLQGTLRGRPFENPFYRGLTVSNSDLVQDGGGDPNVEGARGRHVEDTGARNAEGLKIRSVDRIRHRNIGDAVAHNGVGTEKGSTSDVMAKDKDQRLWSGQQEEPLLLGIIQGATAVAIIKTAQGEGSYTVGEGPTGIQVQSIGSNYVDMVVHGQQKRVYLQ